MHIEPSLDPASVTLTPGHVVAPTAVLSIDIEYDYGFSEADDALAGMPQLLGVLKALGVPLTAFVEGRVLERRPDVVDQMLRAKIDIQLHCYDHREPGDTPMALARGVGLFERALGRRPQGYRANNFRLGRSLFEALKVEGLAWDSSILPAIAWGGNRASAFRDADWFRIDDHLIEFPLASFRRLPLPYIQSYLGVITRPGERVLRAAAGLPRLLVYDMHMVDLFRVASLSKAAVAPWLKPFYRWYWRRGRTDRLDDLRVMKKRLTNAGYRFTTLSALFDQINS